MMLANQYEIQNEDDVIYFLLTVVQKLNLPSTASVQLICNSTKINLETFTTITKSIQELSELSIEITNNNDFFNSILCV
jgi:hypothetical protein